jgi:trimeric autotransporter adhesin
MKLLVVLLLTIAAVGCGGYGSSYNSMTGGGAAPKINSLSPQSKAAGSAAFTLTITGSGFTAGSVVYWGTSPIAASSTGYGSATQLTANISASLVANQGTVSVYVHTAAGNSNSMTFTIT